MATHTGPKFGELINEDDIVKAKQQADFVTSENQEEDSIKMLKAEESDDVVEGAEEDEEASSITYVKGRRGRRRRKSSSINLTDLWSGSQPSSVPLPGWVNVVLPAVVVDAVFLLR